MGLHDHFNPPLSIRRHWHAFHNAWATFISSDLNARLPPGYFAEPNVQFGIEIDVAAFEEPAGGGVPANRASSPGMWAPPAPALTVPFPLVTDVVEVLVFEGSGGPVLAGAIELVSPANKDRPAHRDAFVAKCETYLQQAVGLIIIDVVTERPRSLHNELLARLAPGSASLDGDLYSAAYRPVGRDGQASLDVWQEPLAVGGPLPVMPLWLRGGICLPVNLEASYQRTCREQRIDVTGQ